MKKRTFTLLLASLALSTVAYAKTPPWVRAAIPAQIPATNDAGAIVLLDDTSVTVGEGGTLNTRYRRVVKILTNAGRGEGVARAWFDQN
ncbi:MAG TPA: transglutaminase, partial [Thermoanaerobaculia bacterium]